MARFDAGWYVPSSIFPGSNILDVPKQRIQCDPCLPFYEINQLFELGSLLFSFEVVISRGPPFFLKLEGKFHYYLFHIGWAVHFIPEFDILLCITTSSYRKGMQSFSVFTLDGVAILNFLQASSSNQKLIPIILFKQSLCFLVSFFAVHILTTSHQFSSLAFCSFIGISVILFCCCITWIRSLLPAIILWLGPWEAVLLWLKWCGWAKPLVATVNLGFSCGPWALGVLRLKVLGTFELTCSEASPVTQF